jgi:multidrug efflux pump subunit AcrB
MTLFGFVLGVFPLAFARGAAPGARVSMGIAVCAGMTFATLFGIFVVPVLFVAVEKLAARVRPRRTSDAAPAPAKPGTKPT